MIRKPYTTPHEAYPMLAAVFLMGFMAVVMLVLTVSSVVNHEWLGAVIYWLGTFGWAMTAILLNDARDSVISKEHKLVDLANELGRMTDEARAEALRLSRVIRTHYETTDEW